MKTRILGLLAVALLGGPLSAAHAAYVYSFSDSDQQNISFAFTTSSLLTADTTITGFDSISSPYSSVKISDPTGSPSVRVEQPMVIAVVYYAPDWSGPFTSVGTYTWSGWQGITMTIREVSTPVPEPGTLALLGLGLAGLGLSRRRRAA